MWTTKKKICYIGYCLTAKWLPESRHMKAAKKLRAFWTKGIIASMGENVNVERGARVSPEVCVGSDSGIGVNCELYGPVCIGKDVMMGPECVFYTRNHKHDLNGVPFGKQGYEDPKPVVIGNNVWIGRRVMFMAGSGVGDNCVVAAGSVVTKLFPSNVVVGGGTCPRTKDKRNRKMKWAFI